MASTKKTTNEKVVKGKNVKKKVAEKKILDEKIEKREISTNHRIYFSYSFKLTKNILLFVIMFFVCLMFLVKAFVVEEEKTINYLEKSNLDYKVYLKENEFYEDDYLPKDMVYVASLIDKVKIDFNYVFDIEELIDLQFDYKVFAKLIISDQSEKNVYYDKVYNLLDNKSVKLGQNNEKVINESIEINYADYNMIANNFKNTYGLETKSKLVVYFNIDKKLLGKDINNLFINNNMDNMIINIPLSERAVDISMDYKEINNESFITDNTKIMLDNIICLGISFVTLLISLYYMIKSMRLIRITIKKKSMYDKYINKILTEYDRLIVETSTPPFTTKGEEDKVIKIKKFTELLDVRDNLKQPIMYYVVTKHEKCHFYIIENGKIYLTTIKRVDLEEE